MDLASQLIGHLELILLALAVAFAIIYAIDARWFATKRRAIFETWRQAHPEFEGWTKKEQIRQREKLTKAPYFADLARELLVVVVIVFLLRAFVGEPFRIPSGSLLPTLQIGDWLMVTHYNYDVSTPIWRHELFKTGEVKRGDIIVFHFPVDPEVDFIKRVIGLPGDDISYVDKQLIINGKIQPLTYVKSYDEPSNSKTEKTEEFHENLEGTLHSIAQMKSIPSQNFYHLKVPEGQYFVMGDNRDNSEDSRYWGFVSRDQIVGKAEFIFWSWDDHYRPRFSRLFTRIQ
jgi:signal peptidase I